jgi:hypothetical protein
MYTISVLAHRTLLLCAAMVTGLKNERENDFV